jgi:hypothetical protein
MRNSGAAITSVCASLIMLALSSQNPDQPYGFIQNIDNQINITKYRGESAI